MNKKLSTLLQMLSTITLLSSFSLPASAAQILYDWVPDRGSGGSGFIAFDDTNIADPENFNIRFDTTNVINVSFTFDNGFHVNQATNFDGSTTLQHADNLGNLLYEAENGVIDGWSFEYIPVVVIIGPVNEFFDVETTGLVCVVAPCPAFTAGVQFIGTDFSSELNQGQWVLRTRPVPVPAAAWLFATGLIGLAGFARRR